MEDEIPRNGGLWPEYAHTMFLCVDSFYEGIAAGHLYCYCFPESLHFNGIDHLLTILDGITECTGLVRSDHAPRSLYPNKQNKMIYRSECPWLSAEPQPNHRKPAYEFGALQPKRGKLACFYLRIYAKQHASMQGVLAQAGIKNEPVCFRSALELMRMLREALKEADELEEHEYV